MYDHSLRQSSYAMNVLAMSPPMLWHTRSTRVQAMPFLIIDCIASVIALNIPLVS